MAYRLLTPLAVIVLSATVMGADTPDNRKRKSNAHNRIKHFKTRLFEHDQEDYDPYADGSLDEHSLIEIGLNPAWQVIFCRQYKNSEQKCFDLRNKDYMWRQVVNHFMGRLEEEGIVAKVWKEATEEERSKDHWNVTVQIDQVHIKETAAEHLMDINWIQRLDYKHLPKDGWEAFFESEKQDRLERKRQARKIASLVYDEEVDAAV